MAAIFLVPYSDAMTLGQGYNSFLQEPRVHNAVTFTREQKDGGNNATSNISRSRQVSQVVSYSSRFVDQISQVVKPMNIAPGEIPP